ncbi:MAG: flagellar filament capping protein FliD, partial [Gammaproteobacteria bacterium]|nr:flagellar filament capping protein FliD [Gammaproteobacteria bacterium]
GYLASDGRLAAKQGGLEARIKTANNDQAQLNRRMDRVREGLERQFNALDTLVGQMSSTSDFLSAQLARLL